MLDSAYALTGGRRAPPLGRESSAAQAVLIRVALGRARQVPFDLDGFRASIASQVEGVSAARVNSDFPDPRDELSGRIAIYTGGRFLWPAVPNANPPFCFRPGFN